MQINKLDHVNIRTTRLDHLVAWYTEVLGLKSGTRPPFPFPGAWLYAGDTAVVHLVGMDGAESVGSEVELKLEHFAFTASGAREFEQRLTDRGEEFQKSEVATTGTVAYNVWDPDGNHIHVDFPVDE
ncbi:MAG: VOC family protein [Roseibium sp.]|uniref:VOC family protein n=1 Tax=Roseibium sp. TaxID=1936156 RepID=UPI00262941D3|nr:VOC family protein [Roseibium sp.]MCV0424076.1 VOC family protein [Roseibium sp.]